MNIIIRKEEYSENLRLLTENENWEDWILYMLYMVESTAKKSIKRLEEILGLMEWMSLQIKEEIPKNHSNNW